MRTLTRRFTLTALAVALLALGGCGRSELPAGVARHIVVISIDTARADHFGFMGNEDVATPGGGFRPPAPETAPVDMDPPEPTAS